MAEHRVVRGLNPTEYNMIMCAIRDKHELIQGKCVKYVETTFDFRTYEYWRMNIRCFGQAKEFITCNREVGDSQHDNLFDEIMDWLSQKEEYNVHD